MTPIRIIPDFSRESLKARRSWSKNTADSIPSQTYIIRKTFNHHRRKIRFSMMKPNVHTYYSSTNILTEGTRRQTPT